jgi:hypothetical protein
MRSDNKRCASRMTIKEVSKALNTHRITIIKNRKVDGGIPYEIIDGKTMYRREDIVNYLIKHNASARFVAEELTRSA